MSVNPKRVMTEPPVTITLPGIVRFLWANKWLLILGTAVSAALSVAYALWQEPVYRAEALVQIDELRASPRPAGGLGGLGALASVVGFEADSGGSREEALAILKSRSFTQDFIERNDLLTVLFADLWDADAAEWRVPPENAPTVRDAFVFFDTEVRAILEDRERGMITLRIDWRDREQAARWVADMLADADRLLRDQEVESADRNIRFLNTQLEETPVAGVRQSIYQLMEAQIERKMLANSRAHFIFEVIDPATVPDEREYV
ncbi:MAG: Wzz/FepE/Etk N-terminal domain-containing protein, partial [Pseudomonadota bacterium]